MVFHESCITLNYEQWKEGLTQRPLFQCCGGIVELLLSRDLFTNIAYGATVADLLRKRILESARNRSIFDDIRKGVECGNVFEFTAEAALRTLDCMTNISMVVLEKVKVRRALLSGRSFPQSFNIMHVRCHPAKHLLESQPDGWPCLQNLSGSSLTHSFFALTLMLQNDRPAGPMARRLTTNQEIAGSIPA